MARLFRNRNETSKTFHKRNGRSAKLPDVGKSLDKQFGRFLRQQRGDQSYAVFARKLGISLALFSTQFTKPLIDGRFVNFSAVSCSSG